MAKFNYNKSYEDYLKEYYEKEKQRKQYEAQNNPGSYNSKYQSYINDYMGRIANREPFNYDYATDKKYQAYRDEQMRLGQRAMRDTAAQAATLTGGYGNSYGATAAASMYNQYAQQAANMIPQYEELAYNRWRDEGQDMYNRLAMYQNADATDYGRYRDQVGDFQAMLNYYTGLADTAYNRGDSRYKTDYSNAYNMWRAQQADEESARDYAFKREQYEYQKQQDAIANEIAWYKANNSGGSGGGGGKTYTDPATNITYDAETGNPISHNLGASHPAILTTGSGIDYDGLSANATAHTGKNKDFSSLKREYEALHDNVRLTQKEREREINSLAKKYIKMGYDEEEVYEYLYELSKSKKKT